LVLSVSEHCRSLCARTRSRQSRELNTMTALASWLNAFNKSLSKRRQSKRRASRTPLQVEALENRLLPAGPWTPPAHQMNLGYDPPMMLLTDGTVLALGNSGSPCWRLTPDASGSYINGTWSQVAAMQDSRLYFPSEVLPDGRVFVAGGEYGNGQQDGE